MATDCGWGHAGESTERKLRAALEWSEFNILDIFDSKERSSVGGVLVQVHGNAAHSKAV